MLDNRESTMTMFKMRGISFAEYDMPHVKTEKGIAERDGEKVAWFTDPAGNILGITQSEADSGIMAGSAGSTKPDRLGARVLTGTTYDRFP